MPSFLDDYLNRLRGAPVLGGALDLARQELGPLMGGPGGVPIPLPRSPLEAPFFAAGGPLGVALYRKSRLMPEELTGALLAAAGHAPYTDPALSAAAARLREAGAAPGPPDVRLRAVNAAAAREAPIPTMVLNAILDPQSYVNPGGGAARPAAQLAERAAPEAATVVRGLLGPGAQVAERAAPEAEQVASRLAADVPPPPPAIAAPPRAPLTADTARDLLLDQIGGAPLPARARLLGALNEANFGGGAGNAMRAVTGGADLGALGDLERPFTNYLLQRTIETPAALESLQTLHPGLHAAVDLLPDLPERTALDLQNEVRRAAGLPEKVVKPTGRARAAKVEMPAPEAIAPQEAVQAQGGASAGVAPDIGATPGGDVAAGGMGGQAPIQLATTLAGAAGGGVAGYQAAGDQASPTDRAAATLTGAAAGGTAGHLGPALLARPGESALRGIAAAGGGPVELAARGILGGDIAGKVLPFAREEALAQHVAGSQVEALLPRLRQMGGIWARNVTQTARNVAQDETWLQFVLRGLQPGAAGELGTVRRAMADRLRLGTEWERYPTTTTAPLEAAGVTDATLNLGQTFHGTEGYLNEVLSNTQNAIGEAGLSFLNPVKAAMNLPSVAFAGAKGYARNYQSGLFKAVNQFQQLSARHAVFADEFTSRLAQAADRFLPDLERRGYDVTPLRDKLASEGAFSPDDVRTAMLGDNPAVQAWERTVGAVKDQAEGRARKLLGDYSKRGVIERKAGGVVPFVSWQLRAWPVMAEMIATHPGAALAVGNLLRLSGQQVTANKEPLRNVGTIPIATPAGTVRLNPLAAVAPGSPEMLSLGNEDPNAPEDRTAYQTASDLLQKVGLGFGPGLQALAYATSQDYKGPGPLSRTAGIENAIGQVPLAQLPSLGAAGLDAARLLLRQPIERVSVPAALPVAGAAQPDYDPNLRRAQEAYYDATGKAIGQPGTAAGAAQTLDPTSPLMARARGDVATSGALRNALSLVLPVGVQAQTPEAARAQQVRANAPISAAELARYKEESPTLYKLAAQRNAQYQAANPVAALYEANTPTERKLAILHDWDRQHSGLLVDRKVFLARRQQVMDALGLKENATTRFDPVELAAPAR
jgi:hypothetical protein